MVRLSSYKLVQLLKKYINPEGIEISIGIRSCMIQKWLGKLRLEYKEVHKNIFVDDYE